MHKNNKLGYDPFVWWTGVVEDRQDPLKIGRCRVRIIGTHTDDKTVLPTSSLPWAHPLHPINNPNSYAPKEGDMVVGFFMDSSDGQFPIMFGLVPGIATKKALPQKGFYDNRTSAELKAAPVKPNESQTNYPRNLDEPTTSRLARNENIDKTLVATKKQKIAKFEPQPYYGAKYPYNNVYESESGHVLEFDDTKDAERVHLYHRKGSFIEIGPDGSRVDKIEKNSSVVIMGDAKMYVKGKLTVAVDGDMSTTVAGSYSVSARTISLSSQISSSMSSLGMASVSGIAKSSLGGLSALTTVSGGTVNINALGILTALGSGAAIFGASGTTSISGAMNFITGSPVGGAAAAGGAVDAAASTVENVPIDTTAVAGVGDSVATNVPIGPEGAVNNLSESTGDFIASADGNVSDLGQTLASDQVAGLENLELQIGQAAPIPPSLTTQVNTLVTSATNAIKNIDVAGAVSSAAKDAYTSVTSPILSQMDAIGQAGETFKNAKTAKEAYSAAVQVYQTALTAVSTAQNLATSISSGAILTQVTSSVTSNITKQASDNLSKDENIKLTSSQLTSTFNSYVDGVKDEVKTSSFGVAINKAIEDVKLKEASIREEVAATMVEKRWNGASATQVAEAGAEAMKKAVDKAVADALPNYPNSLNGATG